MTSSWRPRVESARRLGLTGGALLCSAGLLLSSGALADDARLARAQALLDEGRALMKRRAFHDACARFERSREIEPGLGTLYHLADCWEHVGRAASAHSLFEDVAAEADARGQRARARIARARARSLEPRLLRLVIEALDQPGLVVSRDGSVVAAAHFGAAIAVDPGVYRIEATLRTGERWSQRVEVSPSNPETVVSVPELRADAPTRRGPAR